MKASFPTFRVGKEAFTTHEAEGQPPVGSPARASCAVKGRNDSVYSYVLSGWT
ncbi:Hypothetical protein AJAP_17370 [Amycolatopsis japonica]|uniref:Uncharacterized protein n=1 Tax=Amycolatopsis japonica TaxID=208439 RepID=A0A075UQ81_9PSEU|nr:Hypothetical protein AJAP_17370 [Amycolatopsis japonica]